ncbi:MAG: response regulator transcription factor [Sphingomonas sp.]
MEMLPIDGVPGTTAAHAPSRTILVVDDSRSSLAVMARRLTHHGYLPVLCDNGPEALDLIAGGGFDLILLDMVMPGMSGLEVLADLRGTPDLADLPVIVMTARSDAAAAVEALRGGADDFVTKPFAVEMVAARIERAIIVARRVSMLKKAAASLDARIATRAMELGEVRAQLAEAHAERLRLLASLQKMAEVRERA